MGVNIIENETGQEGLSIEELRASQLRAIQRRSPCMDCPFRLNTNHSRVEDRKSWTFLEKNKLTHVCHTSHSRALCAGHQVVQGKLKSKLKLFSSIDKMFQAKGDTEQ